MKKQSTFKAILAIVLVFSFSLAIAQIAPIKQWDKTFGAFGEDQLCSLQQTTDGGYILGGWSYSFISCDKTQAIQGACDYWIVKIDANGVKQWDKTFGGNRWDELRSLQQTADGGYILGGNSDSEISGDKTQASQGFHDYWIVKTDASGVKQWDKTFGGASFDYLHSLQQTADGGYILGGYSKSGKNGDKTKASQGYEDYWIVKTDANGVKQWDKTFGGDSPDFLTSLQQTTDGGYILGGWSSSAISGDKTQASQGGTDYWIVKTDVNGIKQWDRTFGGSSDDGGSISYYAPELSLQQTIDGGYILGGYSNSGIGGDKTQASQGGADYWIVKTDANGVKLWDARFGGDSGDQFHSLQQTADGGYILGGFTYSGISGDKTQPSQGDYDYWIVKTDANGVKHWDARFGGNSNDLLYSLKQTADGGYILGGWSFSEISGDKTQGNCYHDDYWIVKVSAECNGGTTVYADNDGDGYGDISNSIFAVDCIAPDGYVYDSTDCNDSNVAIYPGACDVGNGNGIDDNCDGLIDDGFGATNYYVDADGDGYGAGSELSLCENPGSGYSLNNSDCDDENASVYPGACDVGNGNGIDDNCDGFIDDGFGATNYYVDADGDGYGAGGELSLCENPGSGYSLNNSDCDDANELINPAATEICDNNLDDNCNGLMDENCGCHAPMDLQSMNVTAVSAVIGWDAVEAAEGYKIRYKVANTDSWMISSTLSTSKKLKNLQPGTEYVWQTKSSCEQGPNVMSEWSLKYYFTTLPLRMQGVVETMTLEVYPNPSTTSATITFSLVEEAAARIELFDLTGRRIISLFDATVSAGVHETVLYRNQLPAGIYLLQFRVNETVLVKKVVIH